MITRWHIKIYWFTIIFLFMVLVFLSIPDHISLSSGNQKSRDSKINDLASQYAGATSAKERAQVGRQYNTLMKKKSRTVGGTGTVTLLPVKIFLIVTMIVMIYIIFQSIWYRQKNLKTRGAI
jgi:uncharacterized membrane protein (UPF0182 family)